MSQISVQFEADLLIALYMFNAKSDTVSSKELYKFNDYLSKKLSELDMTLSRNEKLNSMFLFSDFYLNQLKQKTPRDFKFSKKDVNDECTITCAHGESLDEKMEYLKTHVLSRGANQNAQFMEVANGFAKQYMKENNIGQPKSKQKLLTPEEDEQRWWNYFGK